MRTSSIPNRLFLDYIRRKVTVQITGKTKYEKIFLRQLPLSKFLAKILSIDKKLLSKVFQKSVFWCQLETVGHI